VISPAQAVDYGCAAKSPVALTDRSRHAAEVSGGCQLFPKNSKKFKDRVREITGRNRGVSMSHCFTELRRYFQGWVGYFSLVPIKTYFVVLDQWVRRRIRSCYWKQWRRVRTRIQNLLKLGVRNDEAKAVTHGISSNGRP